MGRYRIAAVIGALAIVVATSAAAEASVAVHNSSHIASRNGSSVIESTMLPDRVSEVGSAHFAAIFGAIEVTGRNHVIVYLTSLSKTAEEQLSSLGAPGQVSFKLTSHNRDQLLYLQAEVTASAPWLRAAGVQLVTWFPGVNGDGLEHIGVYDLNPSKAKILYSHFGSRNIVLQNVNRNELPVATDSGNRVYDSMPWNGGDNITSHGIGCTSGVGIDYFGIQYMLTASHCYDPGWAVYNEFAGVSRPNNLMGIEKSRDIRNGGDDTALIAMPVSNRIWAGAIGVAHSVVVAGAATNLVGDVVYNEGAYSGQLASVVQNNYAGCITSYYDALRAYRTECNIIWARSTGIANQEGDSGGPMVRWIAGRLYVTGIVSAGTGSVTCQYNAPYSNECFHNVYYTAATEILAIEYPGATIG